MFSFSNYINSLNGLRVIENFILDSNIIGSVFEVNSRLISDFNFIKFIKFLMSINGVSLTFIPGKFFLDYFYNTGLGGSSRVFVFIRCESSFLFFLFFRYINFAKFCIICRFDRTGFLSRKYFKYLKLFGDVSVLRCFLIIYIFIFKFYFCLFMLNFFLCYDIKSIS